MVTMPSAVWCCTSLGVSVPSATLADLTWPADLTPPPTAPPTPSLTRAPAAVRATRVVLSARPATDRPSSVSTRAPGSPATATRSVQCPGTSQSASASTAWWSARRGRSPVPTGRSSAGVTTSVPVTRPVSQPAVSTPATSPGCAGPGRSARCWSTRPSVCAPRAALPPSPSV